MSDGGQLRPAGESATPRRGPGWRGCTALVAVPLAAGAAATQYAAWRLHYHPLLGTPWLGHLYAPWSVLGWMRAPWAASAHATFQRIGLAGFGAAGAGMLGLFAKSNARRTRPVRAEGIHGTARFQTPEEVAAGGLMAQPGREHAGVYIGAWTDAAGQVHYLRHDGPGNLIVIAPTRSGKGVGVILPNLLSWTASSLIYDEKGELWDLTAGWRGGEGGNTVIRWEPAAIAGSAGFNFLEEVRIGTPYEVSDVQNIALMICDPKGEGIEAKDHWAKTAFAVIAALALHVLYQARARNEVASLADVADRLSDPDREADQLWEEMRTNRHLGAGAHPFIAGAGRDMLDRPEKERGSVLSTAKTYLDLARDPIVAANIRRSDFRLSDLMDAGKPVSLYVVTRGADKERLRPFIRLFLTMALRALMGVEMRFANGQPIMPHRHRLLMLLDEFPSLGRLQVVQDALPKCAGYGITALLAAQNREQLFGAYGQYQSITGNCQVRIIFAPNEIETARWISDSIGVTTEVVEAITESGKRGFSMGQVSRTYHATSRAVMTPDEIMALRSPKKDGEGRIIESGQFVAFIAGARPVLGTQILHFADPVFSARGRIPPPPSGSLTRARARFHAA